MYTDHIIYSYVYINKSMPSTSINLGRKFYKINDQVCTRYCENGDRVNPDGFVKVIFILSN